MKKLKIILIISSFVILFLTYGIYNIISNKKEVLKEINENSIIPDTDKEKEEFYFIDIKGEVVNPGVYEVELSFLVNDVINLAGGLTENAYTDNINLSKKIENEMVIFISSRDSIVEENIDINVNQSALDYTDNTNSNNELININNASLSQLIELNGIGESKAQAIIDYRNNNGLFNSIEEIQNVSGIGSSTYDKIKNNITI